MLADEEWTFANACRDWSLEEKHACMIYEYARESASCLGIAEKFRTLIATALGADSPTEPNLARARSEAENVAQAGDELSPIFFASDHQIPLTLFWDSYFPGTPWMKIDKAERDRRIVKSAKSSESVVTELSFADLGDALTPMYNGLRDDLEKWEKLHAPSKKNARGKKAPKHPRAQEYQENVPRIAWDQLRRKNKLGGDFDSEIVVLKIDWKQGKDAILIALSNWLKPERWPARYRPKAVGENSVEDKALRWLACMRLLNDQSFSRLARERTSGMAGIVPLERSHTVKPRRQAAAVMQDLFSGIVEAGELPRCYPTFSEKQKRVR